MSAFLSSQKVPYLLKLKLVSKIKSPIMIRIKRHNNTISPYKKIIEPM